MKTIFLTGGTGFLGTHFLGLLRGKGWCVKCLTRWPPRRSVSGVQWVRGDLSKSGPWEKLLRGCDVVVHLATMQLVACEKDPRAGARVIVGGVARLLAAASRAGVKRAVMASTCEVYGSPRRLPVRENTSLAPLSVYGHFKAMADAYALEWAEMSGMSLMVLRFSNLYGAGMGDSVLALFARSILAGKPVVLHRSHRNSRDFLHVMEAAKAVMAALKIRSEGIVNIGSGRETRLKEAAGILAGLAGRPLEIDFRPREGRLRRFCMDTRCARRVLGFRSKVALEQGLKEVLEAI